MDTLITDNYVMYFSGSNSSGSQIIRIDPQIQCWHSIKMKTDSASRCVLRRVCEKPDEDSSFTSELDI